MIVGNQDFNNNSDQDNSPGLNYTSAMDGAPGATVLVRKGPITRWVGSGNLTASRVITFDTVANQKWKVGDQVWISVPTHTGGGFTLTVENIAASALATYAALLANGGMFYFNGTDFEVGIPGNSTT